MQQIRFCGFAGQGIVIAARILGEAAFQDKKNISLSTKHGSQVRGGVSKSDLIISDNFIDFPMITEVDFLISMEQEAYEESLFTVKKDGRIITDSSMVKAVPTSPLKHYSVAATEMSIQKLKSVMVGNIVLLAYANAIGQFVSKASLEKSIKNVAASRFVQINLNAMELGLDLAEKQK